MLAAEQPLNEKPVCKLTSLVPVKDLDWHAQISDIDNQRCDSMHPAFKLGQPSVPESIQLIHLVTPVDALLIG